jgi:hypothetical protein
MTLTTAENTPPPPGTLVIPPPTPGYPLSARYGVLANGEACPVYDTRVFFELNNPNRVVSFAQFDFTGEVEVEVVLPHPFERVRIRPTARGIASDVDGQSVRFRLDAPAKLSIEFDGDIDGCLHLFAGRPEVGRPSPDDPDVLYYGPGIHYVDGEYGILQLKSNTDLYLAPGAVLRARLLAENAENIRIRGRGMLEGTTLLGRHPRYYREFVGQPDDVRRPRFARFDHCRNIQVEGIIMNDPPAWCLALYDCENVRVKDIKQFGYVDNSDGIDIVSSRDVVVEDVFLRMNDDCVVLKSTGGVDCEDVEVRDSVLWSDRAQALQIGHETNSDAIRRVVFRNIDILEQRNRYIGHYALGIYNGDTARITDVLFDDIRVENHERLIGLIVEKGHYSRAEERGSIEQIHFRNIDSATTLDLHLTGTDDEHGVRDVIFENLTVRGEPAEPEVFANLYVHDLTFKQRGIEVHPARSRVIRSMVSPEARFVPLDIGPVCNRSRIDVVAGDGVGWLDLGPEMDMRDLAGGVQTLGGVPFHIADDPERGAIVLRSSQHLVEQPYASYPVRIDRTVKHLFFLHGTAFTDTHVPVVPPEVWIGESGKLRFNQSPSGTPLWHYRVRYADDGTEVAVPVKAGWSVEDWEIWAPGGWVVHLCGKKFYIQQWDNPYPDKPIYSVKVQTALRPEVPIVLGVTMGVEE